MSAIHGENQLFNDLLEPLGLSVADLRDVWLGALSAKPEKVAKHQLLLAKHPEVVPVFEHIAKTSKKAFIAEGQRKPPPRIKNKVGIWGGVLKHGVEGAKPGMPMVSGGLPGSGRR